MMTPEQLVDASFVIINGYALQKIEKGIQVVNIHKPDHAAVFSEKGELLETNMDDIEAQQIQQFIKENYEEMYQKWSALSDEGYYRG